MKKIVFLSFLVMVLSFGFIACKGPMGPDGLQGETGNDGKDGLNSYVVIFNSNGGTPAFDFVSVLHGGTINVPTIWDSRLAGWYKDTELTDEWNFAIDTVTDNTTLYARWYEIGDTGPGGGIIFHITSDGFTVEGYGSVDDDGYFASYTAYCLEAAPSNSSDGATWGDYGTLIENGLTTFEALTDTLADKIGNGRKDTQIIAAHMDSKDISNTAAQVCTSAGFGSLDDWFLPSSGELNLLYENNNITTGSFWTSSQLSNDRAWVQLFGSGGGLRGNLGKQNYLDLSVRAVRAF